MQLSGHNSPTPVNKKNWLERHPAWTAIGVAAILFICLGAAVGGSSNDSSTNQVTKTPTQSSPQKSSGPATAPVETTQQKILDWYTQYGEVSIAAIESDSQAISTDAGNGDITAVATDCQQLDTDVTNAQSQPPIPDTQAASDYSSGLSYYQAAAQQCVDGATNDDSSEINSAANLLTEGNAKISATNSDIAALKTGDSQ